MIFVDKVLWIQSREDVGIVIRSAFLAKGSKQKFSLFVLVILSIVLLFFETIDTKPLNYFRAFIKDVNLSRSFSCFNSIKKY